MFFRKDSEEYLEVMCLGVKMSNHDLPDKPSYEMAKNFLVTKINFVFIFPQVSLSLTLIFTSADPKCVAENMFRVPGST